MHLTAEQAEAVVGVFEALGDHFDNFDSLLSDIAIGKVPTAEAIERIQSRVTAVRQRIAVVAELLGTR